MICSLKFKTKKILLSFKCCFGFCAFGIEAMPVCPIQVVISLPLWIKLTMGHLLLFFLCNFSSFFSYVGGILVTNNFSLLLDWFIVRYILAIQQIITHEEHLRYSSELPQKPWHHGHNNRKWLKQPKCHFH